MISLNVEVRNPTGTLSTPGLYYHGHNAVWCSCPLPRFSRINDPCLMSNLWHRGPSVSHIGTTFVQDLPRLSIEPPVAAVQLFFQWCAGTQIHLHSELGFLRIFLWDLTQAVSLVGMNMIWDWLSCCMWNGYKDQFQLNTLRPGQNGRHFADDNFKHIFVNENVRISIKISLKFVPTGPINNVPALVQIMAWRRPGNKPLSEPMVVSLLTHICVTRPQWVNCICTWLWLPCHMCAKYKW